MRDRRKKSKVYSLKTSSIEVNVSIVEEKMVKKKDKRDSY
jgi:hypothetical protein